MGVCLTKILFQPPSVSYTFPRKNFLWIYNKSGAAISAFHIVNRKAKVTILFSHGNAEDLGMIFEWLSGLSSDLCVNVFAYDYEGYGLSTGVPSEVSCYESIDAAYNYLTEVMSLASDSIVVYGRSLGSGPSCYIAERLSKENKKLGGLILHAPLSSVFRIVVNFRITPPFDPFPNIDRMPNIQCPVLVMHGVRDEIVPFWHGEELFLATPIAMRAKPYWVMSGNHNNLESISREQNVFNAQLRLFLVEWVPQYIPDHRNAQDRSYT